MRSAETIEEIDEGNLAFQRKTGRNSHYILLRDSCINKSVWIFCFKIRTSPSYIRCQKPYSLVLVSQSRYRFSDDSTRRVKVVHIYCY